MKRGLLYIFIFIILIISINAILGVADGKITGDAITGNTITGDTITGDATQDVALNVSVTVSSPTITIHSPKNHTYINNKSILLNFTITSEQSIWYNLDNTANISINSSISFSTSEGGHILFLFANSSNGNETVKNVSFSINISLLTILYSEFNGSTGGNSTEFINYSYEELQNFHR